MAIAERNRLAVVALASLAIVGLVAGIVLLAGGGPRTDGAGSPVPSSLRPTPTDPGATPEGAVWAFLEAFARARRTDDAALVAPFVSGRESPAYLTIFGFLEGQAGGRRGVGRHDQRAVDVLLTGYFDRWQRNLRRTLELIEDHLHPSGVAWVMCDRRLMSSDPRDWDQMVTEAREAERYSRRLGERITDGYAAKFRRLADPGGRAPLGLRGCRRPSCSASTRTPSMSPCGSSSGTQSGLCRSRRLRTSLASTIGA